MEFRQFNQQLQAHLTTLLQTADIAEGREVVFVADVNRDAIWNAYLDSFPEGTNKVFRERREFDCNCCKRFIRELGPLVLIRGGRRHTIWELVTEEPFATVARAMNAFVAGHPIANRYVAEDVRVGTPFTMEGATTRWEHLSYVLPTSLLFNGRMAATLGTFLGEQRTTREVFERSLTELSPEAVATVLELIAQGSLYKGDEWRLPLSQFAGLQQAFLALTTPEEREIFTWSRAHQVTVLARIKNHSIGVLLKDVTEGVELDRAVATYEKVTAPSNYKRPKEIFTKKMLEDAQRTVESLGFGDSLGRRFARLDDVPVTSTLFVDRNAITRMRGGVFEQLATQVAAAPKNFDRVEEVPLERFLSAVLPSAEAVEVYLDPRHAGNRVSLLAPLDRAVPSMFKWGNSFSWAYTGNITDSVKERVKALGGGVDGALRFSIQWNEDADNNNDFDAHCREPNGNIIYYAARTGVTGGVLDVDIREPNRPPYAGAPAVENITWATERTLKKGKYQFLVHNFAHRGGRSGFLAEIEFAGETHTFEHRADIPGGRHIPVADVHWDGSKFTLTPHLENGRTSSRELWGLKAHEFHRVQFASFSPNFWPSEQPTGHQHLLLMLANCVSDEQPNGFFNEFLRPDLERHRHVFAALGSKMKPEPTPDQLSGLGFSMTKRDSFVVRVTGQTTRVMKVLV